MRSPIWPNEYQCSWVSLGLCVVRRIGVLAIAVAVGQFVRVPEVCAVRPFVTDDARIVYKGELETESFAGVSMANGSNPVIEARSLQGLSFTDRFELIAGGFGFTYQSGQARPLDMLVQPKYVLHRSFGIIPSISVAAGSLFPLSGNKQQRCGFMSTPIQGRTRLYRGMRCTSMSQKADMRSSFKSWIDHAR